MQPTKLLKLLLPCTIAATIMSTTALAKVEPFSVGFSTVPNIAITPVTAMDFGAGLGLGATASCIMSFNNTPADTDYPGDVVLNIASGTGGAGATVGTLTGTGCEASAGLKGTLGVYEVSGVAGGTVNVTINDITAGTDFNWASKGCIGTYTGAADGDTCTDIAGSGTSVGVVLATDGDTVGNSVGSGIPAPGITRIILAGTITAAKTHVAGEPLSEIFTIDVTY
ncbi:MAG: hypothetical protein ACI9LM_004880 [Alteromonadaceae bacterium]|jgi:hypothetical protein